jgi:catechol 2,3-dioxygenase-like lactoylglutathione lyase family enzyme
VRAQPLIAVADVEASSRWYQRLLDCKSGHGGPEFEQLLFEGEPILQLHAWDAEAEDDRHVNMGRADIKSRGNGVLLWFETDDLDAAVARAKEIRAEILERPHINPKARHRECWLRDPDGYVVVLASRARAQRGNPAATTSDSV